jgi:hypothetical protein
MKIVNAIGEILAVLGIMVIVVVAFGAITNAISSTIQR